MFFQYGVLILMSLMRYGHTDIPFYYEMPSCRNGQEEKYGVSDADENIQPYNKRYNHVISSEASSTIPINNEEVEDLLSDFISQNRKKRSTVETKQFSLPALLTKKGTDTQTIHIPPQFTPRLGRKRSFKRRSEKQLVSNFSPRLGRSEDESSYRLNAVGAFTPRLGRSNKSGIHMNVRNGFKPRLGRSDEVAFRSIVGNAFTPRLGRSDESRILQDIADLGRLKESNRLTSVGSSFTPRLGRSEEYQSVDDNIRYLFKRRDFNKVNLNTENTFIPRLGRSKNTNSMNTNDDINCTPRLGRSEGGSKINLNTGSGFTPRLG